MYALLAILALILLVFGIDVFRNRHELKSSEILQLVRKRQRNCALSQYRFCTHQRAANPDEKKSMKALGEFVRCDFDYYEAPSRVAALLKYKKHEWIVFAFIRDKKVIRLWWNKGPDGTTVWSYLQDHALERAIDSLKPDALAVLHNHPNPDPSRYCMTLPSDTDLASAGALHHRFVPKRISLLEFICERGVPHLYYAAFSDHAVPIKPIIAEIQNVNGTSILKNYFLRKELKRNTTAEQIRGGLLSSSAYSAA